MAFAVLVVGGYALRWTWTGFQGNTLWDWLQLLLVPFVMPAVIVWVSASAVKGEVEEEVEELAEEAQAGPPGTPVPPAPSRARAIP